MTNGISGAPVWNLVSLQQHLQGALHMEFWTIPYYLSAMYSIRDPSSEAFQLIQSVVHQEMLHAQLVCNLINAFGGLPEFKPPVYGGPQVPHLDYSLDDPNPTQSFSPFSTEIGPFDLARLNTMCLIEYPQWGKRTRPDLKGDRTRYGSIGEFYDAIGLGIAILKAHVRGNVRQVDFFSSYYNNVATTTITRDGMDGLRQAFELLNVVTEQGEGKADGDVEVPLEYRNTADGFHEDWSHFRKFTYLRNAQAFPATFAADPEPGPAGRKAQQILVRDFASFVQLLNDIFQGRPYQGFGVVMAKIGGDILSCWQNNAVPKFS